MLICVFPHVCDVLDTLCLWYFRAPIGCVFKRVLKLLVIVFFVFLCLNSWSSHLLWPYSCVKLLVIMFFVVLLLCFLHGCRVICGPTLVLELLVVVFLSVLLRHLNFLS